MATVGKPILCRAAVVWKKDDPFTIETVEVAVPKRGEVRVRMTSTGICHSDEHIRKGCVPDWYFPSVLGHEGAGFVESVGENVTSVKQGDLVVLCFKPYCGECNLCKDSRVVNCVKQSKNSNFQLDGTTRITCRGQILSQMFLVSTFSEYTVTSEYHVAKVNPKANPKSMALAGCCVPTGYGAAMVRAKVTPGSTCAIWGLGGVGMCTAMGCRDSEASRIIGIDTNSRKFELAKEFGCTDFLNPNEIEDVPKKLAEMTNGGVDFCFVSVGFIPAMEQAFNSSHPYWGKTVIIGLADFEEKMKVGIWDLLLGRQLMGTCYGSYKARLAIPNLVEKVLNGQIQLEKLITHRLPLEKINEAYALLFAGESIRTIIEFDLEA